MKYYSGTLRIKNPRTLGRWIKSGKYKNLTDKGYIYAYRCGRFRMGVCECHQCRKLNTGAEGLKILEKHEANNYA